MMEVKEVMSWLSERLGGGESSPATEQTGTPAAPVAPSPPAPDSNSTANPVQPPAAQPTPAPEASDKPPAAKVDTDTTIPDTQAQIKALQEQIVALRARPGMDEQGKPPAPAEPPIPGLFDEAALIARMEWEAQQPGVEFKGRVPLFYWENPARWGGS